MIAHSAGLDIKLATGNIGSAIRRKAIGGEGAILTRYTALRSGAWVTVAPAMPGDVIDIPLQGGELVLQQGSFIASVGDIDVTAVVSGPSRILMKEGVSELRARGTGRILIGSYGGLMPAYNLRAGDAVAIDTGHLVAYDRSISVKIRAHGGVARAVGSAEGLVAHLSGPGRVFVQTRSEANTIGQLFPERAQNRS